MAKGGGAMDTEDIELGNVANAAAVATTTANSVRAYYISLHYIVLILNYFCRCSRNVETHSNLSYVSLLSSRMAGSLKLCLSVSTKLAALVMVLPL